MDFDFSPEQYMFQDSVREFLNKNYTLPEVRKLAGGDGFDRGLWKSLAELGIFSMLAPADHGGLGLTLVDLSLIIEEFGRALVPAPAAETIAATDVLARYGTRRQQAGILPRVAAGELVLVPAILEASASFDPEDIGLTAAPSADGWAVSGAKIMVPHAAIANFILLALRFGENGPLGLAVLETGRRGITWHEHSTMDPLGRFYEVRFDDVFIGQGDVLGGEPAAAPLHRLLESSAVIAATLMLGIASKVLDNTVDYVKQRVQFGKPIGTFQAIKHRCADLAVATDTCRSAVYYAAWALAEDAGDRVKAVSAAKSYCGDTSRAVCNEAVQLHGGIGFTWDLGLHFYLRRAKLLEYSYGDAAYHRERVVSETLAELAGSDQGERPG